MNTALFSWLLGIGSVLFCFPQQEVLSPAKLDGTFRIVGTKDKQCLRNPGGIWCKVTGPSPWREVKLPPETKNSVQDAVFSDGELLVLAANGVYRSSDDFSKWQRIADEPEEFDGRRMSRTGNEVVVFGALLGKPADLDRVPNTAIDFATGRELVPAIAILSRDGKGWAQHAVGETVGVIDDFCSDAGRALAETPYDVFWAADFGNSWRGVRIEEPGEERSGDYFPTAVACPRKNGRWLVAFSNRTMAASEDGTRWDVYPTLMSGKTCGFGKLAFDDSGKGFALCGEELLTSTDWGHHWRRTEHGSVIDFYMDDSGSAHVLNRDSLDVQILR